MKKILSIMLALVLICSVASIGANAANINVAPTQTAQLFYSNEPFEDVTPINGYVFGYIGDTDQDGDISIMDATAIQLHIAQLTTLSEDAALLADVDFDDDVSIIDTTEIQLYIAQLSENPYITHTLYEDDYIEYTFDEITNYLMEYGDYDATEGYYCTFYMPTDIEDVEYSLFIAYTPENDQIDFFSQYYQISNDVWVDTLMRVYRGDPVFLYGFEIYDADYTYCKAFGTSELFDLYEMTFSTECTSFESDYYSDFSEVADIADTQFMVAIAVADELMWEYIDGYVSDIFW